VLWSALAATANPVPPAMRAAVTTAEAMSFERFVLRRDIDLPFVRAA
jgi:hypothetical protein